MNGMECDVMGWNERSKCLTVLTKTNVTLAVYHYTDPAPEAQGITFFPIRLGYASTIYKLQGAQLDHITIWLDVPGQRAAAYVALSRVRHDADYLFAGQLTKRHFVPNG